MQLYSGHVHALRAILITLYGLSATGLLELPSRSCYMTGGFFAILDDIAALLDDTAA